VVQQGGGWGGSMSSLDAAQVTEWEENGKKSGFVNTVPVFNLKDGKKCHQKIKINNNNIMPT
jgi:hypothetical protein